MWSRARRLVSSLHFPTGGWILSCLSLEAAGEQQAVCRLMGRAGRATAAPSHGADGLAWVPCHCVATHYGMEQRAVETVGMGGGKDGSTSNHLPSTHRATSPLSSGFAARQVPSIPSANLTAQPSSLWRTGHDVLRHDQPAAVFLYYYYFTGLAGMSLSLRTRPPTPLTT